MKIRVAFLLLLVFASAFAITAVVLCAPVPVVPLTFGNVAAIGKSFVKPLGDPIGDPTFPH